jgi:hypothetical protein
LRFDVRRPTKPSGAAYTVGYGRPPKRSQFKPGKSGNPRGRPKGSRSLGAVLEDVVRQRVTVTENGKSRSIPLLDVILRRLAADAARSDAAAMRLLMSLLERHARADATEGSADDMSADDRRILARYLGPATEGDDDDSP